MAAKERKVVKVAKVVNSNRGGTDQGVALSQTTTTITTVPANLNRAEKRYIS